MRAWGSQKVYFSVIASALVIQPMPIQCFLQFFLLCPLLIHLILSLCCIIPTRTQPVSFTTHHDQMCENLDKLELWPLLLYFSSILFNLLQEKTWSCIISMIIIKWDWLFQCLMSIPFPFHVNLLLLWFTHLNINYSCLLTSLTIHLSQCSPTTMFTQFFSNSLTSLKDSPISMFTLFLCNWTPPCSPVSFTIHQSLSCPNSPLHLLT